MNVELMNKIADQIEKHPETYDQSVYKSECGTAYCIAGWACVLSGEEFDIGGCSLLPADSTDCYGSISIAASNHLGMPLSKARSLFNEHWEPSEDLTVPAALRELASGTSLIEVTHPGLYEYFGWTQNNNSSETEDEA